jgi:hypothetical protein
MNSIYNGARGKRCDMDVAPRRLAAASGCERIDDQEQITDNR